MLIYYEVESDEFPSARVHNVDTGITYRLAKDGEQLTVNMKAAAPTTLLGINLAVGQQAVAFWRALLSMNPRAGDTDGPEAFLRQAQIDCGMTPAAEVEDIPF